MAREATVEADGRPRDVRLQVQFRGDTAHRPASQGRDQLPGALRGLRVHAGALRRRLPLVRGTVRDQQLRLDELLATKLRALYQRKQGRDLFDLATALGRPGVSPERIVAAFSKYMEHGKHKVTRALFEKNMAEKLLDPEFTADIGPLLADGYAWDIETAAPLVSSRLIELLPGAPWKRPE